MTMATLRRWHFYLGMLNAPSVLFFALTGALQLFHLHEAHGGYVPPALIEKLASVHKDQVFAADHHQGPPPGAKPNGAPKAAPDDDSKPATLVLKVYFLVVSLSLAVSTAMGVWIGLVRLQHQRLGWALLAVGAAAPIALLLV
jgi:hypothetical protein